MQGRLKFRNQQEVERAQDMGIKDMDKKYSIEELAGGEVMFAATGVTDGDYLEGIHFSADGATSQSIVMRSKTRTIRVINATHHFAFKPGF